MTRKLSIEEFAREVEEIAKRVPEVHRDLHAELAGYAIDQCVERSPVLTGAYRASHTVTGDGGSGPGPILYEGPERVADDEQVPTYPLARYAPGEWVGCDRQAECQHGAVPAHRDPQRTFLRQHSRVRGRDAGAPRVYEMARLSTEGEAKRLSERKVELQRPG